MKLYLLIILILILIFVGFGQTQTATTPDGKKVILKSDGTWEFESIPIKNPAQDKPATTSRYAGFKGDDFEKIINFVRDSKKIEKDEFETEADFRIRFKKYARETQIPELNKRLEEVELVLKNQNEYDAEKQMFKISSTALFLEDYYYLRVELQKRETPYDKSRFAETYFYYDLAMSRGEAKEAKDFLRIAVTGIPVRISGGPTICLVPTKYIIFNQKSGKIYKEIIETDLVPLIK